MVTKEQALTANRFTHVSKVNSDKTPLRVRRTGKTQTWKTRPDEFKVPVKYGMYESGYITHDNAHEWNVEQEREVYRSGDGSEIQGQGIGA